MVTVVRLTGRRSEFISFWKEIYHRRLPMTTFYRTPTTAGSAFARPGAAGWQR